jgi:prophage regulatory protein
LARNIEGVSMQLEPGSAQPRRILRMPEVERRTGRARSSIYRDVASGLFPAPLKIGPRAIGWLEVEIEAWLSAQIAKSRASVPTTPAQPAAQQGKRRPGRPRKTKDESAATP